MDGRAAGRTADVALPYSSLIRIYERHALTSDPSARFAPGTSTWLGHERRGRQTSIQAARFSFARQRGSASATSMALPGTAVWRSESVSRSSQPSSHWQAWARLAPSATHGRPYTVRVELSVVRIIESFPMYQPHLTAAPAFRSRFGHARFPNRAFRPAARPLGAAYPP